ncbi:MAG TPA: hypothetical protein VJZ00_19940 [Thermoanaerobaculia bacterium]|nr:hypothetical protein [Thermoanaerobaculia bacterium]
MRVWSRIALVVVVLSVFAFPLAADHLKAECPLSLADSTPPATAFDRSPHGVFRFNSLVYVLRGQILATYSINDVGNLVLAREDFLSLPPNVMNARETEGGVAFNNGFLYVSSEAGLEIFDLRNTRVGGTAPTLVSRTPNVHYRRMTVTGNRLAGLYPTTDMPCYPITFTSICAVTIDILDITNNASPVLLGQIRSNSNPNHRGFNDIKFNSGFLIAVGEEALMAFDITNPALPVRVATTFFPGKWLVSNGTNFIGVGNDDTIDTFAVRPTVSPFFVRTSHFVVPVYVQTEHENRIRFNRSAFFDDANARLITLIDEVDPQTLKAARTLGFEVFDFTVTQFEGSVERIYEDFTYVNEDERKYNPVAAGAYVYVIGETTGVQSYGACGQVTGRIELDSPVYLTCGGAEIHGWVTGAQRIVNVELFLNDTSLGAASLGETRHDVSSTTPVTMWRIGVNLDNTARGEYQLRAIGTDALGNRRQFAFKRIFFEGPGKNCTTPRRRSVR